MAFKKACTLDDIWEGDMETFDVDGTEVLLVHVKGEGISRGPGTVPRIRRSTSWTATSTAGCSPA